MDLRNPIIAYVAVSNLELQFLASLLLDAGIPAMAVEDVTSAGEEIHRPKLWVEREDAERVGQILMEFEQRNLLRRNRTRTGMPIVVECDDCDVEIDFDASLEKSIQKCPLCGRFLDVEVSSEEDDPFWIATDDEE